MRLFRWILGSSLAALVLVSVGWSVPLNESFDLTYFPPVGWQTLQTGDGANVWIHSTGSTHSGLGKARSNDEDLGGGEVSERWLITPRLRVVSADDSVTFWARPYLPTTNDDSVYVLVSTTNSVPASFTNVLAGYKCGTGGDITGYSYLRFALGLGDYAGDSIYVAFLHTDQGSGGNTIYLDDVTGPELLASPSLPYDPQPEDGAVGIGTDVVLYWTNGAGTDSVDLYLAMTYDSVDGLDPDARKVHNQLVDSYDPGGLPENHIYYWRVVAKNQYGNTNGVIWCFHVAGDPMAGSFDVGGGANDYASFTEAVMAVMSNGVSGAVVFNVYGTDYDEAFVIGEIAGTSAVNTVTFTDASGSARVHYTGAFDAQLGVVGLDGADYVIFDGIDIVLGGQPEDQAVKCLRIEGTAQYNQFRNATFRGAGVSWTSVSYVVYMLGPHNDGNLFHNMTIRYAREGLKLSSYSAADQQSSGIVIDSCTIDSVWIGIECSYMEDFHVRNNDIQLNLPGNTGSAWGIYIDTHIANDTTFFYNNKVHNIVSTSSSGSGMARSDPDAGTARIFNNFCYDFQTTESAQVRAIYISGGDNEIYFNSVRVNDVNSTGTVYAVYLSGYNDTEKLENNIFYNGELTNTSYGIGGGSLASYLPEVLDYNVYYGPGSDYTLFSVGGSTYGTLEELQDNTAWEDHGLEGDPGFTSATDLHILETEGLVSNVGTPIAGISDDIDGDVRLATPDIGADEYTYLAPPGDYAVLEIIDLQELYPELTTLTIQVRVQNRGSEAQADVPVRLFYEDVQQDEELVSLAPNELDTIDLSWTTPAAPDAGTLKAQCFLTDDSDASNDSVAGEVMIISQPLSGSYDIGGGSNDYADFTSAVADLMLRGIDGPVTFQVYGTTYNEAISIGEIPGASAVNTVTFLEHAVLDEPVVITYGTGSGTVEINGGDYLIFDGIDITATGGNTRALEIMGNADYNTVRNCNITGAGVSGSSNYAVYVIGGGNDYNKLENVTVRGGYYGIRLSGTSSASDMGNEVVGSTVREGKYAVYTEYQQGAQVHDCDIQPGWVGASTEVSGLYVAAHSANCSTYFYGNEVHNVRTSSNANGIYVYSSSGRLRAYNNFVYDYQVSGTGALYGLRVAAGYAELYFNSVRIGDVGTTGNIYGYYQASSTSNAVVENNIIEMDVPTEECWGIYQSSSGTLTSDYNCFYGTGTGYNMGFQGTSYATLNDWQVATGLDANSVEGEPGFVGERNLHVHPTYGLVDSAGIAVPGIVDDIDGETRAGVPDIGADEYLFQISPHDYAVNCFVDFISVYVTNTLYVVKAELKNWGTLDETDVPVVLFYNDVPKDTAFLSLLAGATDTVELDWLTPSVDFEIGQLEVQAFCPNDGYARNDSITAEVSIVGAPLSGSYDLGGGDMDFANFTEAVSALALNGIDGPVTFECYTGTYVENIEIPAIAGASYVDRITFRAHETLDDVVTLTSPDGPQVLHLNGADFLAFYGINIIATGSCDRTIYIENDADYNSFRNLTVGGRDSSSSSVRGVIIHFLSNDNLLFDNVTVRGCYYGIRNENGNTSDYSSNLEISNCTLLHGRYCVYLDNVDSALVHDNDIQPGGDGTSAHTYGVYIASLGSTNKAYVYNNRIHNLRNGHTTSFYTVAAVETHPTGDAESFIYNNFIYDFTVPNAEIHGIHIGSGTSHVYHNSFLINDVGAVDEIVGIYLSTGYGELVDNIVVVEEATATCYGIWRYGGTLVYSDYNCIYGTGTGFNIGRDGSTDCPTLTEWQGFGYDMNSITGDPGFVSAFDLHINVSDTVVSNAGTYLALVPFDIDGNPRMDPPDIGADEYYVMFPPDPVVDLTVYADMPEGDAILRWSSVENAQGYNVYAGDTPFFETGEETFVEFVWDTTYTHTGILLTESIKFYVVLSVAIPPPGTDTPAEGVRREE